MDTTRSNFNFMGGLVTAAALGLVGIGLVVLGVDVPTRHWLVTVLVGGLVILGKPIVQVAGEFFSWVIPMLKEHWRPISVIISTGLGLTISVLAAEGEGWRYFTNFTLFLIAYAVMLHAVSEAIHYAFVRRSNEGRPSWKIWVAILHLLSMAVAVGTAFLIQDYTVLILNNLEVQDTVVTNGAALFLSNYATNYAFGAIAYIILSILVLAATWMFSGVTKLRDSESARLNRMDPWLRRAKIVTTLVAIFVGYVVGSGYAYDNGLATFASNAIAVGIGLGTAVVFFMVEGKVLEACFTRKYHGIVLSLLLLGATAFAATTAYLSFGKVYHVASAEARFAESQGQIVKAQNAYLSAVATTCDQFSNATGDKSYKNAVKDLRRALVVANTAGERHGLATSVQSFQQAAKATTACLSRRDRKRKLLEDVKLFPEPSPSDLSSQYFMGEQIPGVSLHIGAARQALVAVCVLDFLIVILALFGLLFGAKQTGYDPLVGYVVSLLGPDRVLINKGEADGVAPNDGINLLDDDGNPVGTLTAVEPVGNGAFNCRTQGRFSQPPAPGMQIRLI